MQTVVWIFRGCVLSCLLSLLVLPSVQAQETSPSQEQSAKDVQRVADRIDQLIAARWKKQGIKPTDAASDAEFIRRVHLHLIGSIPRLRTRSFLKNPSPTKRQELVKELLESPGYIMNSTRYWRRVMLPETDSDLQTRFLIPGFEAYLREQFTENAPYDEIAKQIINVQLNQQTPRKVPMQCRREVPRRWRFIKPSKSPRKTWRQRLREFFWASALSAQCHDHPFDTWKQNDFWSLAAFFGGIVRDGQPNVFGQVREVFDRPEIRIPESETTVQAGYLDGSKPQLRFRVSPRKTLADWVASRENPYFAKAAANRIWGHFFGRGIVDPVDDFSDSNPPSHPELLDFLAYEFAEHKFDLKFLIQAITQSKTYQLSSRQTHDSQENPRDFARMSVQGLTPIQLYESLAQATGSPVLFAANNPFFFGNQNEQGLFQETFDDTGTTQTDRETTILQALALMNGQLTATATDVAKSRTLSAVVNSPFLDQPQKIEALFLAALSRKPNKSELKKFASYVEKGGPTKDPDLALADVFWALLNSSEFLLNH